MTTGATLYLVSACGTAEEFVAAFRRYADRTGLFIPAAAPLPAGRRGRLALTLKDGGVMIEGEAEILQSSAKPSVVHGRPGMTIKFLAPDDLSKTVIAELEKARLAMRPAPPSVPPRPASVAAEPRPVVPAVGGRIDAANALAECVVIGDPAQLADTASSPIHDSGSGKAKFIVPSIPGVGSARPNSPSTPPPVGRPNTPSTPPPPSGVPTQVGASPSGSMPRLKTPTVPPDPASKALPAPSRSKLTSIGFPALDKAPAPGTEPRPIIPGVTTCAPAENPLLQTTVETQAPAKEIPAEKPQPQRAVSNATTMGTPALDRAPAESHDEVTTIGEVPPTPPTPAENPLVVKTDPMPAAAPATAERAPTASQPLARPAPASSTSAKSPSPPGPTPGTLASAKAQRATSIGFPAVRTPFETQPVGTVRPPMPGSGSNPAAPIVPEGATAKSGAGSPGPRGKNPTRPPLSPRHPTPVAPVPIVRSPAKAARVDDAIVESAIVEEEKTDLSGVPTPPPSGPLADTVDALVATQPQRSGGMRASEIMAAIPSGDWTMSPDASGPTVVGEPTAAKAADDAPHVIASKTAPKGPPTGNWSISLDPETGWSEPVKVEKAPEAPKPAPAPKARKGTGTAGNPDMAVSEKGFTAVQWEEKPTGIGEAKIEIDSTLMEPLTPMPDLDEDAADPALAGSNPRLSSVVDDGTGRPIKYITPPAGLPAADSPFAAPPGASQRASAAGPYATPPAGPPSSPPSAPMSTVGYSNPGMPAASSQLFANAPPPHAAPHAQFGMMGFTPAASGGSITTAAAKRRKQTIIIGIGAIVALAAGFVLVLVIAGGKETPASGVAGNGGGSAIVEAGGSGSGSAEPAVGSGSALAEDGNSDSGSDSAVAAVDTPPDAGNEEVPVVEAGSCKVAITSVPNGADVYQADQKLGATPLATEMPCGVDVKLTLRKARFINTTRSFTPKEGKANKVVVKLARPTFTLKVTSSPAGATITVGGRSMGVTPATVRLPAHEGSAIMVSKPGYLTNSKTVTPKSNNISHHVVLKKGRR